MADTYLGESIKKLGFGLMRLPMIDGEIDIEQTKKMVDKFMAKGFTYFDTAYVYINGRSEVALKEAVVDRYPRDSFVCATKLPIWDAKGPDEFEKILTESLTRAGLDYYDFYLLHAMDAGKEKKAVEMGAWDFIKKVKEDGRAKHIGFSFHDSAEVLDQILSAHPEAEFVQLQINYADWEDDGVQARKCYETARKHNVPVIIMEPVKGGTLVTMPDQVRELFKAKRPELSIPSWAMRFAASLDGVITVLSGMSNEEQMDDNISYMENFEPLSEDERELVMKAVDIVKAIPTIPCTRCKYCVDGCPQQINIPDIFSAMNHAATYNDKAGASGRYRGATKEKGKASDCIGCGACQEHCPQHIEIIEQLKKAAGQFE